MTRSAEFALTVKRGVRAAQPDLVVHARRDPSDPSGPRVGFVVTKALGTAVDRHRAARRLRHLTATLLTELDPADRIVVRALPGMAEVSAPDLERELRRGVQRACESLRSRR